MSTFGEDPKKEKEEEESVPLNKDTVSGYRQLVARTNSVAQDRADSQYAVKEVCRGMCGSNNQVKSMVSPTPIGPAAGALHGSRAVGQ